MQKRKAGNDSKVKVPRAMRWQCPHCTFKTGDYHEYVKHKCNYSHKLMEKMRGKT
jgi:hypothetical protein